MKIPSNVIANADDLGLCKSVNKAILLCYENGYINSTSLLTNTVYFNETVLFIGHNPVISNIGVHINLAEDKPVSDFPQSYFLTADGNWDISKTNKKTGRLTAADKQAFTTEINAQINRAIAAGIPVTHLDAHYHLHTLPCFYQLFLKAALKYNLKLRLAQTYNEGSWLKFAYRKYINQQFKKYNIEYAERFETVAYYLANNKGHHQVTEVMLHPDINADGLLTDHYHPQTMANWVSFLNSK